MNYIEVKTRDGWKLVASYASKSSALVCAQMYEKNGDVVRPTSQELVESIHRDLRALARPSL